MRACWCDRCGHFDGIVDFLKPCRGEVALIIQFLLRETVFGSSLLECRRCSLGTLTRVQWCDVGGDVFGVVGPDWWTGGRVARSLSASWAQFGRLTSVSSVGSCPG